MRNLIAILVVSAIAGTSNAQKNAVGINVSAGRGFIMKEALVGGPSYRLNSSFSLGLQYDRQIVRNLHFVTGINWYNSSVSVTPGVYPGIDRTPKEYDLQMLYLPIMLKVDFARYFFVTGGLLGDFDISSNRSITSQSGAGAGFGLGAQFDIKDKYAVQLSPYFNFHGLLMTKSESYPERVADSGFKLNFLFRR